MGVDRMNDNIPYGLRFLPYLPSRNELDGFPEVLQRVKTAVPKEFSDNDIKVLVGALKKLGPKCKMIVEIGINRNCSEDPNAVDYVGNNSTRQLIDHKEEECIYLGIDINRTNVDTINKDYDNNDTVVAVCIDSSNTDTIEQIFKSTGCDKIDLLHIDGHHSVIQVIKDWKLVRNLSSHGIVVLHNTNHHPGPTQILKAIDRDMFKVKRYYAERKDDWGISTAERIPTIREVINNYFLAFNDHSIEELSKLMSEDVCLVDWDINVKGKENVMTAVKSIFEKAPDINIKVENVSVNSNNAACEIVINQDLKVVDLLQINEDRKITNIKAYKQ